MKEVKIQLTEQQEMFLKKFAEKQAEGSDDNFLTYKPLHIVQSLEYEYIPYSSDLKDYDLGEIVFTTDSDYEFWYDDEVELIKEWYEDRDEDYPENILPFSELYLTTVTNKNGKEIIILSYNDYFKFYGVEVQGIAFRKESWRNVAYFFIHEEAVRYMKYQSHNLNNPRTYTVSMGYANCGEYEHFYDLLMSIGKTLNEKEVK